MLPSINLRAKASTKVLSKYDLEPTLALASPGVGNVCLICTRNKSSYCCPRCFVNYCSAACFQEHGVECTETFSRSRVKDIIDFEEKLKVDESSKPVEMVDEPLKDQSDDGMEDPEEETVDAELSKSLNSLAAKLEKADESNTKVDLSASDTRILKDSMKFASRKVSIERAWWDDHTDSPIKCSQTRLVNPIENDSFKNRCDIVSISTPRIHNLLKRDASGDIVYQVFGVLLGHVVAVRTLNGEWANSGAQGISILADSSLVFCDSNFKPSTVINTVERWLASRPHSLQNYSRKSIQSLVGDVTKITMATEFIIYALIECWVLGCRFQGIISLEQAHAFSGGNMPTCENLKAELDAYKGIFLKPSVRSKESRKNPTVDVADKIARKSYFLLLFCFDPENENALRMLHLGIDAYLIEYVRC